MDHILSSSVCHLLGWRASQAVSLPHLWLDHWQSHKERLVLLRHTAAPFPQKECLFTLCMKTGFILTGGSRCYWKYQITVIKAGRGHCQNQSWFQLSGLQWAIADFCFLRIHSSLPTSRCGMLCERHPRQCQDAQDNFWDNVLLIKWAIIPVCIQEPSNDINVAKPKN